MSCLLHSLPWAPPIASMIWTFSCCYECAWTAQSPAAFFPCEKQNLNNVRTQFSLHFPLFMSKKRLMSQSCPAKPGWEACKHYIWWTSALLCTLMFPCTSGSGSVRFLAFWIFRISLLNETAEYVSTPRPQQAIKRQKWTGLAAKFDLYDLWRGRRVQSKSTFKVIANLQWSICPVLELTGCCGCCFLM